MPEDKQSVEKVCSAEEAQKKKEEQNHSDWVVGGHEGQLTRDSPPVFSVGGHCEQFRHRRGRPLFAIFSLVFSDVDLKLISNIRVQNHPSGPVSYTHLTLPTTAEV